MDFGGVKWGMTRIGPKKPFRHFIREWMEKKDISQERLAGRLEVEASTVSKLLLGRQKMTEIWLGRIAWALDVEIIDLLCDPSRPTRDQLLAGLDDDQVQQVVQIVDVIRKTGTEN